MHVRILKVSVAELTGVSELTKKPCLTLDLYHYIEGEGSKGESARGDY